MTLPPLHAYTRTRTHTHTQVAHVFVNLANLVLLSRGKNILSEDFKYYSPGTGRLDRDRFVRASGYLAQAGQIRRNIPKRPPWGWVLIFVANQSIVHFLRVISMLDPPPVCSMLHQHVSSAFSTTLIVLSHPPVVAKTYKERPDDVVVLL